MLAAMLPDKGQVFTRERRHSKQRTLLLGKGKQLLAFQEGEEFPPGHKPKV
jgi:hypothetical protein